MNRFLPLAFVFSLLLPASLSAEPAFFTPIPNDLVHLAAGWSCKMATSCADAVRHWCGGYSRGDGDGIPCENVCSSLSEVRRIRSQIGC
ncbi:hypothetical protein [Martelella alba]|nr:hypothetical protein [Martelella alba]